ncbi:Major facilitator superfamily [Trinorchestia longiramus]|nr:Major facilitator superfamily [Trinorchestia longiramus]
MFVDVPRQYKALVGAVLLHLTFGTVSTSGNLIPYLVSYMRLYVDSSVDHAKIEWVAATSQMSLGGFSILGGFMVDKLGMKTTCFVGCIIFCYNLLVSYSTLNTSYLLLIVSDGIGVGMGVSLAYTTSLYAAVEWFPSHTGLATGVVTASYYVGFMASMLLQTNCLNPLDVQSTADGYFEDEDLLMRVPWLFPWTALGSLVIQIVGLCCIEASPHRHAPILPCILTSRQRQVGNYGEESGLSELGSELSTSESLTRTSTGSNDPNFLKKPENNSKHDLASSENSTPAASELERDSNPGLPARKQIRSPVDQAGNAISAISVLLSLPLKRISQRRMFFSILCVITALKGQVEFLSIPRGSSSGCLTGGTMTSNSLPSARRPLYNQNGSSGTTSPSTYCIATMPDQPPIIQPVGQPVVHIRPDITPREMLADSKFSIILPTYILNSVVNVFIITSYKSFSETIVYDDTIITDLSCLGALATVLGSIVWGLILDKTSYKTTMLAITSLLTMLMGTLPLACHYWHWAFTVWGLSLYFTAAGNYSIMPAVISSAYGSRHAVKNMAVLLMCRSLSALLVAVCLQFFLQYGGYYGFCAVQAIFTFIALLLTVGFPDQQDE